MRQKVEGETERRWTFQIVGTEIIRKTIRKP